MTAPDDETLRRLLAALQHGPVSLRGGDCSGDSRAVNAFVELIRHTPALAAEVLRLRAERDAARETARALGASLAATRADYHAMEEAYYATQAEVLRLRGLISERCAAIETGPVRRRIPGCQTVGPCYVCDHPDREHAVGE